MECLAGSNFRHHLGRLTKSTTCSRVLLLPVPAHSMTKTQESRLSPSLSLSHAHTHSLTEHTLSLSLSLSEMRALSILCPFLGRLERNEVGLTRSASCTGWSRFILGTLSLSLVLSLSLTHSLSLSHLQSPFFFIAIPLTSLSPLSISTQLRRLVH